MSSSHTYGLNLRLGSGMWNPCGMQNSCVWWLRGTLPQPPWAAKRPPFIFHIYTRAHPFQGMTKLQHTHTVT